MPRKVDVKGFDSTIGYTQWANKPAKQDAPVRIFLPTQFLPAPHFCFDKLSIARYFPARSWRYRDLQDERPTDIVCV
jgi:hypothetical protein